MQTTYQNIIQLNCQNHFNNMSKVYMYLSMILPVLVYSQIMEIEELKQSEEQIQGELFVKRNIHIGNGNISEAVIEVTSKGNGVLSINNLNLKVFDEHDDGDIFEPSLLKIEFTDINQDGLKDLVVTGILSITKEDSIEQEILSRKPIVKIYIYDPITDGFKYFYSNL